MDNSMLSSFMGVQMVSQFQDKTFFEIVIALLMIIVVPLVPEIKKTIKQMGENYLKQKKQEILDLTPKLINEKVIKSSIKFTQLGKSKSNSNNDNIDVTIKAINNYLCNINQSKFLHFKTDYLVSYKEEFEISKDISCRVRIVAQETEEEYASYDIFIFSYTLELEDLKKFINKIKTNYIYEQNNKLGTQKYYFDEIPFVIPKEMDGSLRYEIAPRNMTFTKTPFNTNKSLKNVFGDHLSIVKNRIDMFVNNKRWYEEKGLPYTLGVLLHGPPGTGKTSLIKAIAKDTGRHIFNIKLSNNTTQSQLRDLFFNDQISITNNGQTEHYTIPVDHRIYVLEDVDCLTDVVLSREFIKDEEEVETDMDKVNKEFEQEQKPEEVSGFQAMFRQNTSMNSFHSPIPTRLSSKKTKNEPNKEQLNLSFLLNLFDGVLETPGRILIMTSNHPEKLDKALIRPGRIDLNIKVGYCDNDMIEEIVNFFYNIDDFRINIDFDKDITPAELNCMLLNNIENIDNFKQVLYA